MELSRPFIRLPYQFDARQLAQEVAQFDDRAWMAHPNRMSGNSAVPLVSHLGEDNDDFSGRMLATRHLKRCDYMQQAVASFGEVLARSRLMRLAAKSEVSPHVDFNYHWYSRVRIHIPVITNEQVIFHCGAEQVHMRAGECWIFDSWRSHNVINASDQDRVHLVVDTAGSSRFWRTIRSMETKSNDSIEPTKVEYQPGKTVDLKTERFNIAPVMSPGELEAIAKELIADFTQNPDNDREIVAHYTALLSDLAKDWRELFLQYGVQRDGAQHYHALLQATLNRLHPQPRALVTASNNVGVNPIIVQRILRAALFMEQWDAFMRG